MEQKEEKIINNYKKNKLKNKKDLIKRKKLNKRYKNAESFINVYDIVNNGTLLLKDGNIAMVFEISSVDLSLTSSEQKKMFFQQLKYLYQIKDLDIRFYKLDESLNLNGNKDYINKLINMYSNDETKCDFLKERYALLEEIEKDEFTNINMYYMVLIGKEESALKKHIADIKNIYGTLVPRIKINQLTNKYLIYNFLANLYFCDCSLEQLLYYDLVDLLVPINISEKTNLIKTTNREIQMLSIKSLPPFVGELFFEQLFNYPNIKCCIHIKDTVDTDNLVKILDSSYQFLLSDRLTTNKLSDATELDTQKENYQALMDNIKNGDEEIKEVNFIVAITGDKKRREETLKDLKRLADYYKIKLDVIRLRQYETWQAFDVSSELLKDYSLFLPTLTLAASFPLTTTNFNDEKGILLGLDIHSALPTFFDIFKNDKTNRISHNMSIVASTGGGKSYLLKKLLVNYLYNGQNKIFIFDTDAEYKKLTERNNGVIINLYSKSGGIINPLQIRFLPADKNNEDNDILDYPLAKHLAFLETFFKNTFEEISEKELVVLLEETEKLYNDFGISTKSTISMIENMGVKEFPIFSDLKKKIELDIVRCSSKEKKKILEQLDILISRFLIGTDAFLFNDYTNINIQNSNLICFDMQELLFGKNTRIINAQLLNILTFLNNEIIKGRNQNNINSHTMIVFEELHVFKEEKYLDILIQMENLARRSRKYNCSTIFTTQSIHDFIAKDKVTAHATAIFNNCQYQLCGLMKENDLSAYIDLFKDNPLTDTQKEFLGTIKQGEFLFNIDSNKRLRLLVQATPLERYLMGEEIE